MKKSIKKYKLIISVLFVFIFSNTKAQVNLVPNSSFEDTSKIIWPPVTQDCLKYWHHLDSSRYNYCSSVVMSTYYTFVNQTLNLPFNMFAYTYPRNGNNILAMTNYYYYPWLPPPPSLRSVTSSRLKSKLISNKKASIK